MHCLIIGNGVAGVSVARALREKLPQLEIHLLTREMFPYYPRPQLIEFLGGSVNQEQLYFYKPAWYEEKRIEVEYGTIVVSVSPGEKRVILADGTSRNYDWLVLASGCNAFLPPIENNQLPGVFTLRTLADAIAMRRWMEGIHEAVVVGGGYLGLEAAHSLKRAGLSRVVVLEYASRLLSRQLDDEGAALLRDLLADMGVEVLLNASCQAFFGDGRLSGMALADGRSLAADIALISTGVRPEVSFLSGSGLQINKGVVVDDRMRTGDPSVFALGDVAEWRGQLWGIIPPALEQAPIVAANIAGEDRTYRGTTPSNTLKVVGINLAIFGETNPQDAAAIQLRSLDPQGKSYAKLVLLEGKVVGAIALNRRALQATLGKMVSEKRTLELDEAQQIVKGSIL